MLLIDEVDRLDIETEALLLEVLSEYQVSIPELGTVTARHIPQVFLTSNNTRDLSEALKRRCLYLHLGYPSVEREAEIVQLHVPGPERAPGQRDRRHRWSPCCAPPTCKKPPSIAEPLDWARTLLALGATELTDDVTRQTLSVLLKYERDIDTARAELRWPEPCRPCWRGRWSTSCGRSASRSRWASTWTRPRALAASRSTDKERRPVDAAVRADQGRRAPRARST